MLKLWVVVRFIPPWWCGLNNYGQLGIGSIETEYLLSKVSLPLSSESIVSVLSSHGKVFAFGRESFPCKKALIDHIKITMVAGGGQHSAIIGKVDTY